MEAGDLRGSYGPLAPELADARLAEASLGVTESQLASEREAACPAPANCVLGALLKITWQAPLRHP
jgi:hypothetical protein